jgi:aerobic carbon-monoxide dehydrogenase large subunit
MNAPVAPGISAARYIGQRVPRKEDPRLLTGRGQFVDDISLPGMLHAAFARSQIARGKILSIDTAAARDVPGVHAIYTMDDLRAVPFKMVTFFMVHPPVDTPPLADGHVAYVGHPIVLVIADSRAIAEDAAALIEIEYEEEDPLVTITQARTGKPVHAAMENNIAGQMGDEEIDDDLEAQLKGAAHLVSHRVTHQRISQSPMETRGVVATRDGNEELLLYITCQSPHTIGRWLSQALGYPQTAIRVIAKDVGGSFGLKNHPWMEESAVIIAAMIYGRPIKWIEDRYENLISANQAREQEMTLQIGFDAQGKIVAAHSFCDLNNGAFPQAVDDGIAAQMFLWAAYKVPAYGFLTRAWYTNTVGLAAYRGPWAMESLIRETALDKAARQIGIDPVEIRRRNIVTLKDQPTASCMGIPIEDITPAECMEKLLANFDVAAFRKQQSAARAEGRYLGLGVAAYVEPTASAGSITTMTGELAQVRIDPTGKVTATLSTHSQGHGTATTMAQLIADRLGVAYEDVTVFEGDNSRGGFSPGAAGSRQGVIAGGAVISASDMLAGRVKQLAAHLLNASVEAITLEDGMVHVAGAPEMSRSLREIADVAYGEPHRLPPGFESGLEAQFRYQPPGMTMTSAAHLCVVEVSAETGFVTIQRWITSEDCGTVINPAVVEGQVTGGLAQAIGMVLLEEAGYDARGNPIAATYKDYLLPAISDVPVFEFLHANTPSKAVGGMRGVGEGGAIIGPPTLVNAIADALSPFGEVPVSLPLTPMKLLDVIEGRDISGAAGHDAAPHAPVETVVAAVGAPEPPVVQSAATVDGDWKMTMSTPMGPQQMTGHFETTGNVLTGYLTAPEGRQDFTGTVDGGKVKFDLAVTQPMKITLKYDLQVDGDAIFGKVKMGMFGSAKLTGERS